MSNNKITYFPLMGRVEFIRAMFYHKGVEFENETIAVADWPAVKPDTSRFPLGSMPVITLDGMPLYQSKAAARAVAIKFGYYAIDAETIWAIDSILDFNQECNDKAKAPGLTGGLDTEEKKQAWLDGYKARGDVLEARLAGHGKKFIAGTVYITLADFSVAGCGYYADLYNEQSMWPQDVKERLQKIIDGQPNLKRYLEVTLKTELAGYLQKRTLYPF